MILDSIKLQKYKETLERCTRESESQEIISTIEALFNLVANSENLTIKIEASHCIFQFVLNGSYFSEDDKKIFLNRLLEEGVRRLGQGFLNPTIH